MFFLKNQMMSKCKSYLWSFIYLNTPSAKQNLLELEPVVYTYQMHTIAAEKNLTGLWSAYQVLTYPVLQYLCLKASTPYPPPAPEILINERTNHQVR